MLFEAKLRKKKYQIIVEKTATTWEVVLREEGKEEEKFSIRHRDFSEADNVISFLFENNSYLVDTIASGVDYDVYARGSYRKVKIFNDEMLLHESLKSGRSLGSENSLVSGMPGKIIKILVKEGDSVDEGTPLVIMEAMKMENEMKAPGNVTIKKILITEGSNVETGSTLIEFEIKKES